MVMNYDLETKQNVTCEMSSEVSTISFQKLLIVFYGLGLFFLDLRGTEV